MKTLFASLLVLSLANIANAKTLNPPPGMPRPEFCKFQNEDVGVEDLYREETIAVHTATSLTKFQFGLVKDFVSGWKTINTMADLRQLFEKGGDLQYDEVYLITLTSKATGEVIYEVLSYPGDNAMGTFFDKDGNIIGSDEDGSYSFQFHADGNTYWCSAD